MGALMVPIVLIPRFTTLAGPSEFVSLGMDVSGFSAATINVWRGNIVGAGGTYAINFQGTFDHKSWLNLLGSDQDPGAGIELAYEFLIMLPYLRVIVELTGSGTVVTTYAFGQLEARRR